MLDRDFEKLTLSITSRRMILGRVSK